MKHFKCVVGLLAFASLTVLNFAQSEKRYLLDSMASSSSSTPSTSGGSSTSGTKGTGSSSSSSSSKSSSSNSSSTKNPCCKGWKFWASCDQKKVSAQVTVDCTIVSTTYYSASGAAQTEVRKYGVLESSVSAEFKDKAVRHETAKTGYEMPTEVVTCPTSGECNDCEEYRPSCEG